MRCISSSKSSAEAENALLYIWNGLGQANMRSTHNTPRDHRHPPKIQTTYQKKLFGSVDWMGEMVPGHQ